MHKPESLKEKGHAWILWDFVTRKYQKIITIIITIIIIIILILLELFKLALADNFATRVSESASLLKSPGLFSVFCPILTMSLFRWSQIILVFPSPFVPVLWWLYQEYKLRLVSPSLLHSIFFTSLARSRYLFFFSPLSVLLCSQARTAKSTIWCHSNSFICHFYLLTIAP